MKCPWCGEDDFDLPGLKQHLTIGATFSEPCEFFTRCSWENPEGKVEEAKGANENS
jgi:hypothetical protein